jgi:hypothetical protein
VVRLSRSTRTDGGAARTLACEQAHRNRDSPIARNGERVRDDAVVCRRDHGCQQQRGRRHGGERSRRRPSLRSAVE